MSYATRLLFDEPLETSVELDARRADSDLANLHLGDEDAAAA
jgi:hypothetical protein